MPDIRIANIQAANFKSAIVNRSDSVYLTEKTRAHPVMLDAESFNETATFTLSAGFVVDEMPDVLSLETAFRQI